MTALWGDFEDMANTALKETLSLELRNYQLAMLKIDLMLSSIGD